MKILIVAFHDPRSDAIGAQRTKALAEYLHRQDWGVTLLTAGPNRDGCALLSPAKEGGWTLTAGNSGSLQSPERAQSVNRVRRYPKVRATLYRYRETVTSWPDAARERAWAVDALRLANSALSRDGVDMVVSSAPPWVTHQVAAELARNWGVPWAPDYRDLWSISTYYPWPWWRRTVEQRQERRLLSSAAAVTGATPLLTSELGRWLAPLPAHTVLNGYSPAELDSIRPRDLGLGRHLVYAGTWYPGKRDPRPVFEALRDPSLSDVVGHLIGDPDTTLLAEVEKRQLHERVHLHGSMPRNDALSYVASADVALLLTWNDPRDAAVIPGKLYEYIGLRRPILALGYSAGSMAEIVARYGNGRVANAPEEIVDAINAMEASPAPEGALNQDYTRDRQSALWASVLSDIR